MKKFIMCLLTTLMLNQPIYANDLKEIKMSILDDKIKAVKVFESTEDIDFKNVVFADFEKDNFKYVKDSINVDRITKEDKKEQTEVLSFILTKEQVADKNKVLKLFQEKLQYKKDGYYGLLSKDENTLKIEPNKIESNTTYKKQVITLTENKTYYGLESNDYGLIPKTITKNGVTLSLVNANFVSTNNEAISSVANTGVGTLYNCNTVYKGSYTKQIPNTTTKIIDYKASIEYKGNISKEVFDKNLITVSYVGDKIVDLTVPVVATTSGGILGGVVFLFVRRNVRVYNIINGSYQLVSAKLQKKIKQ